MMAEYALRWNSLIKAYHEVDDDNDNDNDNDNGGVEDV
jgi:hypothetical protein